MAPCLCLGGHVHVPYMLKARAPDSMTNLPQPPVQLCAVTNMTKHETKLNMTVPRHGIKEKNVTEAFILWVLLKTKCVFET